MKWFISPAEDLAEAVIFVVVAINFRIWPMPRFRLLSPCSSIFNTSGNRIVSKWVFHGKQSMF